MRMRKWSSGSFLSSTVFYRQIRVKVIKTDCPHINNVRGEITHANSYYSDPYDSYGNFDYVMANEAVICGLTPEKACNIKEFAA